MSEYDSLQSTPDTQPWINPALSEDLRRRYGLNLPGLDVQVATPAIPARDMGAVQSRQQNQAPRLLDHEPLARPSNQPMDERIPIGGTSASPLEAKVPIGTPRPPDITGRYAGASAQPRVPGPLDALSYRPGPQEQKYQELLGQGAPQLHGAKKFFDVLGQFAVPTLEAAIPGTPGHYQQLLGQAEKASEQEIQSAERKALLGKAQAETGEAQARTQSLLEPSAQSDKKIDEYTNEQGQRVLTFQRPDGSVYDRIGGKTYQKPERQTRSSPFEAFAYGTPDEKKAAQDFLDMEKRLGSRYRNPSELDEKYRLFKEDPETYRAMFGDKTGGGPDRATATKMLNYFDKRRREVQQDFTLDDQQKQEQLDEIGRLEQPFMDVVQQSASGVPTNAGGGQKGHRVKVISPDGTEGTVPLSQLGAAKKKGYRVAQ